MSILDKIKELINELIELEQQSQDINKDGLIDWIMETATINYHEFKLNCPCFSENNTTLHTSCNLNCSMCIYAMKFEDIQSTFDLLNDFNKVKIVKWFSNKLRILENNL